MLSVVICTHNRADILPQCLRSLAQQSIPRDSLQVIVVDNCSTDQTTQIAGAWCNELPGRLYVREEKLGLSTARNCGLAAAKGEFIAYTDDDAEVEADWAERIVERFQSLGDDYAVLGGELDPVWGSERPAWLKGHLIHNLSVSLHWSTYARELTENEWICEANCAYRTDILRSYGGFDESLGRVGPVLLSGENFVNELMRLDGLRWFFDPSIRVKHHIHPSRMTKSWTRRRAFWAGVTASRLPGIAKRHGKAFPAWKMVRPPLSPSEWSSLFNDDGSPDEEFAETCARVSQLGYLLGHTGAIL